MFFLIFFKQMYIVIDFIYFCVCVFVVLVPVPSLLKLFLLASEMQFQIQDLLGATAQHQRKWLETKVLIRLMEDTGKRGPLTSKIVLLY